MSEKFNFVTELLSRYEQIIEKKNLKTIQKKDNHIKITIDYNNPEPNNKVTIVCFNLKFEKAKITYTNDELDIISEKISNQEVIERGGPRLFLLKNFKYLLHYILRLDNIIDNAISKSKQLVILLMYEEENKSRINTILKSYKRLTYNSYRLGDAKDTKTLEQKEEDKDRKLIENELDNITKSMNNLHMEEEHKEVFNNLKTLAKIDKFHANMLYSINENNLISEEIKNNLKNQLINNFQFIQQNISTDGVLLRKPIKDEDKKNKKIVKPKKEKKSSVKFSEDNPYLNNSFSKVQVIDDVIMSETDHDSDKSDETETESSTSHIKKEIVEAYNLNNSLNNFVS